MQYDSEIGAKVNKHGAKSLETQATSDNVQYDKERQSMFGIAYATALDEIICHPRHTANDLDRLAWAFDKLSNPSRLSPATSNAPQASLTPTRGIQDDDC